MTTTPSEDEVREAIEIFGTLLASQAKGRKPDKEADEALASVCRLLTSLKERRERALRERISAECLDRLSHMYSSAPPTFASEADRDAARQRLIEAMLGFGREVTPLKVEKWALSLQDQKLRMSALRNARCVKDLAAEAFADMIGVGARTLWKWREKHEHKDAKLRNEVRDRNPQLEYYGVDTNLYCVVDALCHSMPQLETLRPELEALSAKANVAAGPVDEDY